MTQVNYIGTNHFITLSYAIQYYMPYYGNDFDDTRMAVIDKISEGDIRISSPEVVQRAGYLSTVFLNTIEGRYFIKETKVQP